MFWALERRRQRLEKARAEWFAEGYAIGQKEFANRLRDARERGVTVDELLRELEDDARAKRNGA